MAERLLEEHIGAIGEGVAAPAVLTKLRLPWLTATERGPGAEVGDWSVKTKSAYLRRRLTGKQASRQAGRQRRYTGT